MLKLVALAVAAASASAPPALTSSAPWFEKITVTVNGDGAAQSCTYESNLRSASAEGCEVVSGTPPLSKAAAASHEQYTRITFERRFNPGSSEPQAQDLHPGDTLLGGQIMALAIDGAGKVEGCKVLARSGEMTPDYGCEEASKEQFEAASGADGKLGFMTILVYGHNENVV